MADIVNTVGPFFTPSMAVRPTTVPGVTREYPRGLNGSSAVADDRMAFGLRRAQHDTNLPVLATEGRC